MAITYGLDLLSSTSYYDGTNTYHGYFESPLYMVGTKLNLRQFSECEFYLVKELATGEGVRIKWRVNLTDSWTTLGTYTYAALGAITSHNVRVNIPATEFIQVRVELLGTSTTTPQFKSLILR